MESPRLCEKDRLESNVLPKRNSIMTVCKGVVSMRLVFTLSHKHSEHPSYIV